MAYEEGLQTVSLLANADLSASQFCLVSVNSSGRLAVTGDGASADGVLQNKPNAAAVVGSMAISGIAMVKAGAATTAGSDLASDASGRVVDVTTGDIVVGICLEAAGAANDIIPVLLRLGGRTLFA